MTNFFLFFLTIECLATTWSPAYPYTQQIEGQDIVVEAFSYAPYTRSPMIGATKVYLKNKLLYSINKYYRERIFTSNDGQYLVVVYTSNTAGITSYTSFGNEQINFNQTAVEIFKNGKPFKKYALKDVIDTTKLANHGGFFYWGYNVNFKAFEDAELDCESCNEVYGKRVLTSRDTTEISLDELELCNKACDYVKSKEIELNIFQNSIFVNRNKLFILTNQNSAVTIDFTTLEIQKIPIENIIPNKELFNPPKLSRKYKKVKLPDKFVEPDLIDGKSFEDEIADLFGLSISYNNQKDIYSVFIDYLVIDRNGNCIDFYGRIYDKRISEFFTEESIDEKMTIKLKKWINEQVFDTKHIPKEFEAYSFPCIVDLK